MLSRARPEDFSSAANSSNPSPKKQARVVISPDSLSRKRSRIEDQLSDIQYIDCNTPDNPCIISTTAVIHNLQEDNLSATTDQYQPKNKSPRNSHALNRHSLNFENTEKILIPKSLTEMDIEKMKIQESVSSGFNLNMTPTPGTPNYKPLDDTSSDTTPMLSPDLSPDVEIRYQNLSRMSDQFPLFNEEPTRPKSCYSLPEKRIYENVSSRPSKSVSPTYENIQTTICITYRSPVKNMPPGNNSDSIYEDVELNPEKAVVPTTIAELPNQEAAQPDVKMKENVERPKDLQLNSHSPEELLKSEDDDQSNGFKSTTYKSMGSLSSTPITPCDPENSKKSLISPTEISMTDIHSESPTTESSPSISPVASPEKSRKSSSLSSRSLTGSTPSLSAISPADAQTHNSSESSEILSPLRTSESLEKNLESTEDNSSLSFNKLSYNDKRKSCDDEILDDQNAIYQQVKYFRRSIHEINSLLDLNTTENKNEDDNERLINTEEIKIENSDVKSDTQMDSFENFDSLEAENVHIYENVNHSPKNHKDLDEGRSRMHESEPKKIDISPEEVQDLPVCSKCLPAENDIAQPSVKNLTNKFEKAKDERESFKENEEVKEKKPKTYDKDGLPPCLRAKNAKNSVKTKSLDENAFVTEFARPNQLQRRKSLDDRTSSYINSKLLIEPQPPPSRSTLDVSQIEQIKKECPVTEQKLNRERIEKYKEERRNFLREKYRSESFREDKDKIMSRLKQKSFRKSEDSDKKSIDTNTNTLEYKDMSRVTDTEAKMGNNYKKLPVETLSKFENKDGAITKTTFKKHHSPLLDRRNRPSLKEISDKLLDDSSEEGVTAGKEEEFIRHRRGDSDSERKRHTYDLLREREYDTDINRRVSLDSRNPRYSYCFIIIVKNTVSFALSGLCSFSCLLIFYSLIN